MAVRMTDCWPIDLAVKGLTHGPKIVLVVQRFVSHDAWWPTTAIVGLKQASQFTSRLARELITCYHGHLLASLSTGVGQIAIQIDLNRFVPRYWVLRFHWYMHLSLKWRRFCGITVFLTLVNLEYLELITGKRYSTKQTQNTALLAKQVKNLTMYGL